MQTVFQILLRLEHLFEPLEHPELSSDVEVDLSSLFSAFEVRAVQEMALGANVPISQVGKCGKIGGSYVARCCCCCFGWSVYHRSLSGVPLCFAFVLGLYLYDKET